MRGSARFLPWLAVGTLACVVLCLRGPVPPELAIKGGGRSEPIAADLRHEDAAATRDSLPCFFESSPPIGAIPETPDGAVRHVLAGLHENRPDVVWDALPPSYQRDVNDLVNLSARRLHPEAWRWLLQIAAKGAEGVRSFKAAICAEAALANYGDAIQESYGKAFEMFADLLDEFADTGSGGRERLTRDDVGAILQTDGRRFMSKLRAVLEVFAGSELPRSLKNPALANIALRDWTGDSAKVAIEFPDSAECELDFVCVEGKWIPRRIADEWGGVIKNLRESVLKALPSEIAIENFGPTFQILAILDHSADVVREYKSGDDAIGLMDGFTVIPDAMMLLGYLFAGPTAGEPDLNYQTKLSLAGKDKIVLVYCYAGKELKWDNETLDYDLAKYVAYRLNENKIKAIDPDLVSDWLEKNTKWTKTAEIGAAFKADYVVHIDVKDYSLYEPHSQNLYRGRADLIVNVVKMNNDGKDGRGIYSVPIKLKFPSRSPIDHNTMSYAEFKKHYLSALSDEIGRLFYAGDAWNERSETTDEEQAGARIGEGLGALTGITSDFRDDGDEQPGSSNELAPQQREARAVTNSDVVTMVQNGISDALVCSVIRERGGRFDLSQKGIEALKRGGVSDRVIEFLQDAGREKR
jgi:hypothetical protein